MASFGAKLKGITSQIIGNESYAPTGLTPEVEAGSENRIVTIVASSFNVDGAKLGTAYNNQTPVILNLNLVPSEEVRRFVDFASGLVMAWQGELNKIDSKTYILTPASIVLAGDEYETNPGF